MYHCCCYCCLNGDKKGMKEKLALRRLDTIYYKIFFLFHFVFQEV